MKPKINPFSHEAALIIAVLNTATEQGIHAQVCAGKKGYSIKVAGRVIAKGGTPSQLRAAFKARQAKAITAQ